MPLYSDAAQKLFVVRQVARILCDGFRPEAPVGRANLVGELEAFDARPVDVLVLPLEGGRIGDHELDEVVDVIAKRIQGDELIRAELLADADLEIARAFRIEVRVAAEAEAIAAVGRAKRRSGQRINRVRGTTSSPYSAFQVVSPPKVS